ncbi:MAG: GDSL-type esterase/lipase family protein, partial [Polyangiaceae bacterium]
RLLEGALPLDPATVSHVRALARLGRTLGRHPDAFGLVGDSMTVDANFLRPFAPGGRTLVPRALVPQLPLALFTRSYDAPRAAKIGMRAPWALTPRGARKNPVEEMVATESPAYAVVLYGANDALWRTDSIELLRRGFDAALAAVVDALEADGVVPILTTVPKHMRERGWPDCPAQPNAGANERFAVQATVLSADVADLACRRHLPLVDLRWSLDPLLDHGIGPDGVHPSVDPRGGGVLDSPGLQCGYNVRNLVTLKELGRVAEAAAW